jgi:HPt (histidine-containing phosphotransfer) domain-containing protein
MDDELKSVFIAETEDMLLEATNLLLVEGHQEELLARINHVFRVVHSIKGGSQFLGFHELAEISHHMEDLLGPLRSGNLKVDEGITSLMLEALELMETHLQYVRNGEIITSQEFEHKKELIEKIARIYQPEVLPERIVPILPGEVSDFIGKRLVYIQIQVDAESMMPQIRQFLILERLREIGNVVYSQPNRAGLEMPESSFSSDELKIVLSTDEIDEVIRKTCDVGEIFKIALVELEAGLDQTSQDQGQMPTVQEVKHFEQAVTHLLEEFRQKENSPVKMVSLIQALEVFGEKSSIYAEQRFPGGRAGWRRHITLLVQASEIEGTDRERMATCILQGLWESVFETLCNKVYFYTEIMDEHAKLSLSIFQERISMTVEEPQVAVLDLSQIRVLEPSDLLILQALKAKLAEHCVRLALVSCGTNTRRQVNVLEASTLFIKGLGIFPNAFRASFG